jgi:hypothetical protein
MIRATNGAAAIDNGTIVAEVPILVPTIIRDNGNNKIIKIIKGNDRRILTIRLRIVFKSGFGIIPPCASGAVMHRRIPRGSPNSSEKNVEEKTIMRVSAVALQTKSTSIFMVKPPLQRGHVKV